MHHPYIGYPRTDLQPFLASPGPRARDIRTAESVTEGHPDKVADGIADAILDAHLAQDPHARVAVEVLVKDDLAIVAGEVTSQASVNLAAVVRNAVRDIGYDDPSQPFHGDGLRTGLGLRINLFWGCDNGVGGEDATAGQAGTRPRPPFRTTRAHQGAPMCLLCRFSDQRALPRGVGTDLPEVTSTGRARLSEDAIGRSSRRIHGNPIRIGHRPLVHIERPHK